MRVMVLPPLCRPGVAGWDRWSGELWVCTGGSVPVRRSGHRSVAHTEPRHDGRSRPPAYLGSDTTSDCAGPRTARFLLGEEVAVDPVMLGVMVLGGVVVVGGMLVGLLQMQREKRDLTRLLERDPRLEATSWPCGWNPEALANRIEVLPRGDRNVGVRYGVTGPVDLQVLGRTVASDAAAFQWWWEVERRQRSRHGQVRRTYTRRRTVAAAVRLPTTIPGPVVVGPESLFGRTGLTRGGHQLESSEFNRRFRVDGHDRTLTVTLLDANLQELLVRSFPGRTLELRDDLLVLAGTPSHRDRSLTGVVGELPAVRQDVQRLVAAIPPAFWRAVGVTT